MGFRISFGVGPVRYSKSLSGGRRRRKSSGSPVVAGVVGVAVLIALGIAYPIFGAIVLGLTALFVVLTVRAKRKTAKTREAEAAKRAAAVEEKRREYTRTLIDGAIKQLDNIAELCPVAEMKEIAAECAGHLRAGDVLGARMLLKAAYDKYLFNKRGLQESRSAAKTAIQLLEDLPESVK